MISLPLAVWYGIGGFVAVCLLWRRWFTSPSSSTNRELFAELMAKLKKPELWTLKGDTLLTYDNIELLFYTNNWDADCTKVTFNLETTAVIPSFTFLAK